jgi:hypothetical protein
MTVDMETGEALHETFRAAWFSQTALNLTRLSSGKKLLWSMALPKGLTARA